MLETGGTVGVMKLGGLVAIAVLGLGGDVGRARVGLLFHGEVLGHHLLAVGLGRLIDQLLGFLLRHLAVLL